MDDLLSRFERIEKDIEGYKSEAIRVEAELEQLKKREEELNEQARILGVDPSQLDSVILVKETQLKTLVESLENRITEFDKSKSVRG